MTSITSSLTTTSSTTSSSTSSSSTTSSTAYDTFLTLLTTELQNQNPLDPTDSTEFVSQLTSLAQVEQLENLNTSMTSLVSGMTSLNASTGIGYLGTTVEVDSDSAPLQDGQAQWAYTLDEAASDVTLTVTDSDGNTVYTASGDTASGKHSFTWDGTGTSGTTYDSGEYTLSVTATDKNGGTISSSIKALGKVTAVDSSSGSVVLELGDESSVALSDVTRVTN